MATDKLMLLRGEPYVITPFLSVKNPTIGEICDCKEETYWQTVTALTATSYDYRVFLDDNGINYVDIDDWHMFLNSYLMLNYEDTKILIPNVDFAKLRTCQKVGGDNIALVDDNNEVIFDEQIYYNMVEFIRNCHGIARNWAVGGNLAAQEFLMREAREARMYSNKAFESMLGPLISAMCNSEGFKYNFETVWDVPIYAFMDASRRIQKIDSAKHLANGVYSGNLDLSKMNRTQLNKDLNWMGEL